MSSRSLKETQNGRAIAGAILTGAAKSFFASVPPTSPVLPRDDMLETDMPSAEHHRAIRLPLIFSAIAGRVRRQTIACEQGELHRPNCAALRHRRWSCRRRAHGRIFVPEEKLGGSDCADWTLVRPFSCSGS